MSGDCGLGQCMESDVLVYTLLSVLLESLGVSKNYCRSQLATVWCACLNSVF